MTTRTLPLLLLLLLVSPLTHASDTIKKSDTFSNEQLLIVLKNLKDFCAHLESSMTHSVYLMPKLQGSFTIIDPISNTHEARIASTKCGYFLDIDAAKFITGLKSPSAVTLHENATTHLVIPLTEKSATAEGHVLTCYFTNSGRFVLRKRISQLENGQADFVYEDEFSRWAKTHFLTPTP